MRYETRQAPEAVVMNPAVPATASVIWLHGLGADGSDFVPLVPELGLPDAVAPRFVFPNAPIRPVTVNNGMAMRAWYDIYGRGIRDREDAVGIRASANLALTLIEQECAAGISPRRIVLAGFSQGGAIALHAGVRRVQPLAGILALSTYLPLAATLAAEAAPASRPVPILMCHGLYDDVVPLQLARQSLMALQGQGFAAQLQEYPMQHSLCAPEILAIRQWLVQVLPPP